MEHIVDFVRVAPIVQILDAPVSQTVEQLPDILHFFDALTPAPEQVIEVPKILLRTSPFRAVLRDTQLVEQLVEVPTIVSCSWLQLCTEQKRRHSSSWSWRRIAGLQGFSTEQSSTALHVAQERISERIMEQIVDPVSGGGLQDFRPGQSSSSSSHFPAGFPEVLDEPGEGGFRTLPQNEKSAKFFPHSGSDLSADFTSSTPVAQLARTTWYDEGREQAWCRFEDSSGRFYWNLLTTDHSNGSLRGSAGRDGASVSVLRQVVVQFQDM